MLFSVLLLFHSLIFAEAQLDCPQLDKDYIMGNYTACSSGLEITQSMRCRYLKAICYMADSSYDKARYELSLISADVKSEKFDEFNGLALTSLTEVAFLQGDATRAKTLSLAVSDVLIKKLPFSYPYYINEVLLIKSSFDAKDIQDANKRIAILKNSKADTIFFSSLDPWQ